MILYIPAEAENRSLDQIWMKTIEMIYTMSKGFPSKLRWQSIWLQCRRAGFNPWVGKISWRKKWQPTPVSLPGKIPWTEEPGGLYSPLGHKELDMTA